MTERFAGRIRRRVSLVVQPIDDFTDQPVTKAGIHIWIAGEPQPIRKAEGYYIFMDLCREQAVLSIAGDCYETRHLAITLKENGADWQILKPRLTPEKNHPLAGLTVRIRGTVKPDASIFGLWAEPIGLRTGCGRPQPFGPVSPLRLVKDYVRQEQEEKECNEISIYCPEQRELAGRILYISDSRSGGGEFLRLREAACEERKGRYLLANPLSRDYPRAGCLLYPAYGAKADRNGMFFMAIPGMEGESAYLLETQSSSGIMREVFQLKPGNCCVKLDKQRGVNV